MGTQRYRSTRSECAVLRTLLSASSYLIFHHASSYFLLWDTLSTIIYPCFISALPQAEINVREEIKTKWISKQYLLFADAAGCFDGLAGVCGIGYRKRKYRPSILTIRGDCTEIKNSNDKDIKSSGVASRPLKATRQLSGLSPPPGAIKQAISPPGTGRANESRTICVLNRLVIQPNVWERPGGRQHIVCAAGRDNGGSFALLR